MTTDTITLPRSVVELALAAFETDGWQRKQQSVINLRAALEQPQVEQEPIAWANINKQGDITHTSNKKTAWAKTPLYTHPQPPRQPLTDEQITEMWEFPRDLTWMDSVVRLVRAIERTYGIGGEA